VKQKLWPLWLGLKAFGQLQYTPLGHRQTHEGATKLLIT